MIIPQFKQSADSKTLKICINKCFYFSVQFLIICIYTGCRIKKKKASQAKTK